jgi:hypothetical protein
MKTTQMRSDVMRRSALLVLAALSVALFVGACGGGSTPAAPDPNTAENNPPGDIPDNQVFVPYKSSGGFTVSVPEGWARTKNGDAVTFTDKLNSVTVSYQPADAAPTVQSATDNEVPQIESSVSNYSAGDVSTVTRSGGDAILITYEADSPKDPVTGKVVRDAVERYEFYKNGTEAILTLSGPVGADNVDPWMIVSDSFKWTQ